MALNQPSALWAKTGTGETKTLNVMGTPRRLSISMLVI